MATSTALQYPTLPISQANSYDPAYGGIPQLPRYTQDSSETVGPDVQAQMIQNLPGYQGMSAQSSANIANNLAGVISPDVLANLATAGAERGVAMGSPGSPNASAAYLRALGLDSMQLQQLGDTQLTAAMNRTPIQQTSTTTSVNDLGAQQAVYNSAPQPGAAALANKQAAAAGLAAGSGAVRAPAVGGTSGGGTAAGGSPAGGYPQASQVNPALSPAAQAAMLATQQQNALQQQWMNQQFSSPGGVDASFQGQYQDPSFGPSFDPGTSLGSAGAGSYGLPGWQDTMNQLFPDLSQQFGSNYLAGTDPGLYDPNTGTPYDVGTESYDPADYYDPNTSFEWAYD